MRPTACADTFLLSRVAAPAPHAGDQQDSAVLATRYGEMTVIWHETDDSWANVLLHGTIHIR